MRSKYAAILALAVILVAGSFYWVSRGGRIDKTSELKRIIAPVLLRFSLTDDNLVKKTVEEVKLDNISHVSVYVEYDAPRSFDWRVFNPALSAALRHSRFTVFDIDKSADKDGEHYTAIINYGKFDVLTIKINRKVRVISPAIDSAYKHPKVAIVVDDFGYSRNNLDKFFGLKQPITLSILPEQRYSREVADRARSNGFEAILHLPMESERHDAMEEPDTIKTGMSDKEILLRLKKEIACVPWIDGVSNHQGSKATSDTAVMTTIIRYLKTRGLYYFDSLTSSKSVCVDVARTLGVKCAKRDVFIDNSNNKDAIEKQLMNVEAIAFKNGVAIAIGHDRKNTVAVLAKKLPDMARDGIEFVRLSDLVK